MRRLTHILTTLIAVAALLAGCEDKPAPAPIAPVVTTGQITAVTTTTATVAGTVTGEYTELGIVYGTTPDPTIDNTRLGASASAGNFSVDITNLTPGTTYYVRAYAANGSTMAYDATSKTFTTVATEPGVPSITPALVSNVLTSSATAKATIILDGQADITERGFVYTTADSDPTIADTKAVVEGTGTGLMTKELTGLETGTSYRVRGYVIYNGGTAAYGAATAFSTGQTLAIREVYDVSSHRAFVRLDLLSAGGWSEVGICWSTSENPTIDDPHTVIDDPEAKLYDRVRAATLVPSKKYYVRGYAKAGDEVYYTDQESFQTMESCFKATVRFTNIFEEAKPANSFSYTDDTPINNEDFGYVRSTFQDRMLESMAVAVKGWEGVAADMNSVNFCFNKDKENNNIFSVSVRFPNLDLKYIVTYYNYYIDVDPETDFITIRDFNYANSTSRSKQFYEYLTSSNQMKALQDYLDYLTKGPFVVDYWMTYIDPNQGSTEIGFAIFSTSDDPSNYFLVDRRPFDRADSSTPKPW